MSSKKRGRMKNSDGVEPGSWECTVCTYRNRYEAFKCEMCDTRKGTSTRKPKLNQNVVQHHAVVEKFVVQQSLAEKPKRKYGRVSLDHATDSPSTSRLSPESTSSGSVVSKLTPRARIGSRKMLFLSDSLIIRSSAKKRMVKVKGVTACITEFRPRNDTEKTTNDSHNSAKNLVVNSGGTKGYHCKKEITA
uniref:RanBP2-type domain-containing protein n=1 Tax=Syphacia muris TaxID=451379 RepID=A0A158R4N8_9BILA